MSRQNPIIKQCKCGSTAIVKGGYDCAEGRDVYRVTCLSCGDETQWPHPEKNAAVEEWNKMQGNGHE